MSSILAPTNRCGIGLARILGEVESIFKGLCCGLNVRDFSHASQERFVNVLCDVFFFFFFPRLVFRSAYNEVQRRSRRYYTLCLGMLHWRKEASVSWL